ncbi:MAG TPA: DUF1476 domain-containing protein [Rhodospirillaceae bacterium]|jgi:hypothetical protein|nr:DUF1476 domain-containing protein [Alphaproteobacteria bacterium]HBH27098.1 DUF1476 domain-containing protein [Rhodospirillaceae bacterium]
MAPSNFRGGTRGREGGIACQGNLDFQVESRACMIYGLWLAERLGLEETESQAYARDVVTSNLQEPGLDDVLRKVRADVAAKGVDISDHKLERKLELCMTQARKEILGR